MTKLPSLVSFFISAILISHTSIAGNEIDSLLGQVKRKITYNQRIKSMIKLSKLYRENDADKAVEFAKTTINLAEKAKDTVSMACIYEVFAHTLNVHGDYSLSLQYFNKALQLLAPKTDDASMARKYSILAYKENFEPKDKTHDYKKQRYYFNQCTEIDLKTNNHEGLANDYYIMAQISQHEADLLISKVRYGPSYKSEPEITEYRKKELLVESEEYYKKSLTEYKLAGLHYREAACLLGEAKNSLSFKDTLNGTKLLKRAIAINQKYNGKIGEGACLIYYSTLFKNSDLAIKYALKGIELFKEAKYNIEIPMTLDYVARLYETRKNWRNAIRYLKLSWEYQKQNFNENKTFTLVDIRNSYENQLKNEKIKELESKNRIAQLEKQQIWYWIIGGILLVLVFATGAIVVYRLKNKALKEATKSNELKELLNKSLTQKANEAELTALSAEMNPHFVFNVMSSIQGLIIKNKQAEAVEYLNDFSRFSRNTLDYSRQKYIKLSQELIFLKKYVTLESLRFENRFEAEWVIDHTLNLDETEVPPMLIQPFVENAIKHGLLPKHELGKLTIRFWQEQELINCEITDNGAGRKKSNSILNEHQSKGISIVQKRLDLLNAESNQTCKLSIIDLKTADGNVLGTRILLSFPIRNIELA